MTNLPVRASQMYTYRGLPRKGLQSWASGSINSRIGPRRLPGITSRFWRRWHSSSSGLFPDPIFGFSETWQLVINTSTTIITFLMVFLIQNTQNRDAMAMHLKLDELIRSIEEADNAIIRAEDETDEELADLKQKYEALCDEHEELKARLTPPAGNGKASLRDTRRATSRGGRIAGTRVTASGATRRPVAGSTLMVGRSAGPRSTRRPGRTEQIAR